MNSISHRVAATLLAASMLPIALPQGFTDMSSVRDSARAEIGERIQTVLSERGKAVQDEMIVKYRGEKTFRVEHLAHGKLLKDAEKEFKSKPEVEYAEPNYIAEAYMTPNDPYYVYQWHFPKIGMPAAWDVSTGAGVTVAVVDTGVAYENYTQLLKQYFVAPDLSGATFVPGYDFINNDTHPNDDNGHGTHVTGTIAGRTNNSLGVAGIAFNAKIMPVKVLDSTGSGSYAAVANGIIYAADHGAKVINLSLGGPTPSAALESAVQYAYNKGVTIVAAAGNDGTTAVGYPAAYDQYVIAVGATRFDNTKAGYSNSGASLDIVAPGGDTTVDQNGDGYGDGVLQQTFQGKTYGTFGYYFFQGTSMATPHVAGVAALVLAKGNATTPDTVRAALQDSADDLGAPGRDDLYGYGIVDPVGALAWGAPPPPPPVAPTVDLKANGSDGPLTVANGASVTLSWVTANTPSSCIASNAWSGAKNVAGGSEVTGALSGAATLTYTITCTNVSGTAIDSVTVNVQAPPSPTVDLKANASDGPITVAHGSVVSLSWVTTGTPASCTASNAWSGAKNVAGGNENTGALSGAATLTYTITCTNVSGTSVDSVVVNVQAPPPTPPTVDLKANNSNGPITVNNGTSVTLSWVTTGAPSSCTASNAWSGAKNAAGGSQSTGTLSGPATLTYTITCTNVNGSSSDSVTVTVKRGGKGFFGF